MIRNTPEQQEIIHSEHTRTYVKAKAGTGKTTTLRSFVQIRKKEKFLYIVYNKSIKDNAIGKFAPNTDIHTIHSLAYEKLGNVYKEKLSNDLKTLDIFNNLDYFKDKQLESVEIATLLFNISKILKQFFNFSVRNIEDLGISDELTITLAKEYWEKMKNINDLDSYMTHEGYLKLYQLSNPVLNYDYIMVDEAQDSNEVMLEIIYKQNSKLVFVGDEDQKIYGFRGAINVFTENKYFSENVDNGIYCLTESFRFGKNIANVANKLLSKYKLTTEIIKGTDKEDYVGFVDTDMPYTIITRTNGHLFDIAYENVRKHKKIHIIGSNDYMFSDIKDVYYLSQGKKDLIKNEFLKTMKSYQAFKSLVEHTKMNEQKFLIKIIEKYGDNILKAIELISKNLVAEKYADLTLVTAHKSKGLEFLDVKIAEDFIALFDESGHFLPIDQIETEEINLYYVAITRSMCSLELNNQLRKFLGE